MPPCTPTIFIYCFVIFANLFPLHFCFALLLLALLPGSMGMQVARSSPRYRSVSHLATGAESTLQHLTQEQLLLLLQTHHLQAASHAPACMLLQQLKEDIVASQAHQAPCRTQPVQGLAP